MYKIGDILEDREQDSKVIVVKTYSIRSDEMIVKEGRYSDQTVYDFNARYDYVQKSDPVCSAVYREQLQQALYADDEFRNLTEDFTRSERGRKVKQYADNLKTYYFPISRLVETEKEKRN